MFPKIKKITISKSNFILFVSLFTVLFYNLLYIGIRFNKQLTLLENFQYIISELLVSILILQLFLFIFSFSRIFLKLWVVIFFLVSSALSYYIVFYKIFIDETLIAAIFESSTSEAEGVIGLSTILWILFFGVFPSCYLIFFLKIRKYNITFFSLLKKDMVITNLVKGIFKTNIVVFIIISVIVAFIFSPFLFQDKKRLTASLSFYMPANYIANTYQYFYFLRDSKIENIKKLSDEYNFTLSKDIADKPLNIILVIGESSRAKNHSLNGYQRETDRYVSNINNLISFPNVYSCGTLSRVSVSCLLSRKTRKEFAFPIKESNLIEVFKHLGFSTAFISDQPVTDSAQNAFYIASLNADTKIFNRAVKQSVPSNRNVYDMDLMPFIKKFKQQKNKHKLIVIYGLGSHYIYQQRYPKEFEVFKPTCADNVKRCTDIQKNTNAYDNTIFYTGYFLKNLIDEFKNENSFIYYVSDHGEYLGEGGRYFHSGDYNKAGKNITNVVQFIWASDSMVKIMGDKYHKLKQKQNARLSQGYVFHSLLDCFGVSSQAIDKKLSLCR